MRLFIGVELEARVKAVAGDLGEQLRESLRRSVPDLQARWIARENLHITLWFLGEVPEPRVAAISDALTGRPFDSAPFEIVLEGCGAFPPAGAPRVFWVGVRKGGEEMARLHGEIGERLDPLGFVPEKRAYAAHLTLARVKDPGRGARAIRRALVETPAVCGASLVSAVTLFRSRLSPHGANYEPLLRVPLS
jgi:RNA 2',3'-cyclic 3'-phosphodiesterase